jgi:hypothetical protein
VRAEEGIPSPRRFRDLWAGGDGLYVVGVGGVIARWDGEAFADETSPVESDLNAVWGSPADGTIIVGDAGVVLRREESGWSPLTVAVSTNLKQIRGRPGGTVAIVGDQGTVLRAVRGQP